jgi:hypothetical protein
MKRHILDFSLALALLSATVTSSAQPMKYELAGTLSGTFNETDFTNSPFLITSFGDYSDVVNVQVVRFYCYILGNVNTSYGGWPIIAHTPFTGPTLWVDGVGSSTVQPGSGYEYEFHAEYFLGDDANGQWLHVYQDYSNLGAEAPREESILAGASSLTIDGDVWSNLSWSGITVSVVQVVPEPSTLALAGLGAVSLLIQRRRSLRQKSM